MAQGETLRNGLIRRSALVGFATLALALPQSGYARNAGHAQKSPPADKGAAEKPAAASPRPANQERTPFSAAETASAKPEGLPGNLRFGGDDTGKFTTLLDSASAARDPWLVLSGGGEYGAFAAGILKGWTARGDRPTFGVITGVSTGALIAPFAFVGPATDAALQRSYTETSAADVFELGGTTAALTDNWPLKDQIAKSVTADLLKAVATEHAKGRRLLVVTTQVETGRQVVWDMGAIATLSVASDAAGYGDKPLKLFREVILASTAVPAIFPPVMLDAVTQKGKRIQEMHDDGGAIAPFYLAPEDAIEGRSSLKLPTQRVYVVVNNRLRPEFGLTPRTVIGVLGGTVSAAIKAQLSASLTLTRSFAERTGFDLFVAQIGDDFTQTSPGPFDQDFMKALFAHGESLGKAGTAFNRAEAAHAVDHREGAATPPDDNDAMARR